MIDLSKHLEVISKIKEKLYDKNAKLISLMISGSHLYGFESEDSDIDYRGMFISDTRDFLGLKPPKDVIEMEIKNNDIVIFELKKEIKLALYGNCNSLERINAEQIVTTKEYLKLKQLVNNAWGKNGIYNSYKGMATFNYKKFILGGKSNTKKYLYVFRGLMAGIYALQTGKIEPNIEKLNQYFKIKEVKKLINIKKNGMEKGDLPKDLDNGILEKKINDLFQKIDDAYIKSKIPEKPDNNDIKKVNDFLVKMRLERLNSSQSQISWVKIPTQINNPHFQQC